MSATTSKSSRSGLARIWLLNFAGNAMVLAAAYFWLLFPDARRWQVSATVVTAVVVVFAIVWLRAGTLAYFRVAAFRETGALWRAFRHGLRHVAALALWFLVIAMLIWGLWTLKSYAPQFGVWLWQKSPGALRIASPRQWMHVADWLLWFLIFVLVGKWLPLATTVAAAGFSAQRMWHSLRVLKRPMYWLWFSGFVLIGAYIPYKLIWWIPEVSTLQGQAWSMGLRFFAGYLVVVTAFLALVWMAGVHAEREDPDAIVVREIPPASPAPGALETSGS